jgi:hypothetical protein
MSRAVMGWFQRRVMGVGVTLLLTCVARAQIDPVPRQLFQGGYNAPVEGRGPLAAYAFYYHNQPEFVRTNWTLRAVVAPTYLDSELGIRQGLGPQTDVGFGLAGGGFADTYAEVRGGEWIRGESFFGHGAEGSVSVYHLFNPLAGGRTPRRLREVPVQAVLRSSARYATFTGDGRTDPQFELPDGRLEYVLRAGVLWGGREPAITPAFAFELSAWYEGQFRTDALRYGFGDDRGVQAQSHLLWGRSLIAYTWPESGQRLEVTLSMGTVLRADRFSAYRIGGALPLAAEFPLMLPGYYFQEISADRFVLLGGMYNLPISLDGRWELMTFGATGYIDFLPGFDLARNWHSGLGGGVAYHSPTGRWHLLAGYAYGFNAERSGDRVGASSVALLLQYDLEAGLPTVPGASRVRRFMNRLNQNTWRGLERLLGR